MSNNSPFIVTHKDDKNKFNDAILIGCRVIAWITIAIYILSASPVYSVVYNFVFICPITFVFKLGLYIYLNNSSVKIDENIQIGCGVQV